MYRKFYIENGNGDTVTLTEHDSKVYLNNPTGLGYSNTLTTAQYANAMSVISKLQNFGTIGGEIIFWDDYNEDRYEKYDHFISFLTHSPLKFYYRIPTDTPKIFYCDVEVMNIDKSEVKTDGFLRCSFSLQMLSRWKGDERTISGSASTYLLQNDGHMPVGFEITITGSLVNPYFTLSQNGELYGEAKFDDSTAFDSIYVNSNDSEQNVVLEQGGSVLANPLGYQDLSISNGTIYVTFVKLARGESELTIGSDSGSITSVEIKYSPLYRSV